MRTIAATAAVAVATGTATLAAAPLAAPASPSGPEPARDVVAATASRPVVVQPGGERHVIQRALERAIEQAERKAAREAAQRAAARRAAEAARARKAAAAAARQRTTTAPAPTGGIDAVWIDLAQCEASGNWHSTIGIYEGAFQFLNSTWLRNGGGRYAAHAYDASPIQQVVTAKITLRREGVDSWPNCGPEVGLTLADAA